PIFIFERCNCKIRFRPSCLTVPGTSQITLAKAINSSSLQFEWSLVTGADRYILVLEEMNSDPLKSFNWTFTSLSEQVSGLSPATRYACYIYTENSAGRGAKSGIRTTVTRKCSTDVALVAVLFYTTASSVQVQWNPVNKVLQYLVVVRDSNNPNSPDIKNISSTSAEFSSLKPCSTYTVEVSSYNIFLVPGEPSIVTYTTSSPCEPTNVKSVAACDSGTLITTWEPSAGALSYSVEAMGNNGEQYKCSSTNDSCAITGVPCGEFLSVWIDGSGAKLTCTSDTLNCSISPLPCGKTLNVTVTYTDGNCSSTSTPVRLRCGSLYNVSVSSFNGTCLSPPSSEVTVQTSENTFNLEVLASGKHSFISFPFLFSSIAGANAASYNVKATSYSHSTTCSSSTSNCTLSDLVCGQDYDIQVSATDGKCSSTVFCSNSSSLVSWTPMSEATGYTVKAKSTKGHLVSCNSTTPSCTLTNLTCSETYVATVTAHGYKLMHPMVFLCVLAPCPPTNVSAVYTCSPNPVAVSWVASGNAKQYTAVALSQQGHKSECTTNQTSCSLDLVCGQDYDIRVSATDGKCTSNYSAPFVQSRALITWMGSPNALGYNVTAIGLGGQIHNCHTNSSSCEVTDLQCGETYSVKVTAYTQTCTGSQSLSHRFRAGGEKNKVLHSV
uniref:Fibronectin type-III domain-containing protein n=1 Tax=Oryzias melastigma TaxID=30732 RepID=A0A3B3CRU6_ORYME